MAWKSQYNGHTIQRVFVVKGGVLREAVDVYDVKDGAPRKWVREGGHYIPEYYMLVDVENHNPICAIDGTPLVNM